MPMVHHHDSYPNAKAKKELLYWVFACIVAFAIGYLIASLLG
jgi:hypothetical protein